MSEEVTTVGYKPSTTTETDKIKKRRITNILKKIANKCVSKIDPDEFNEAETESNVTNQITILDIDRDIFSWSLMKTDFEQFSTFLPLLKQSNTFLRLAEQKHSTCTKCHLQFKRLLWSLFSGFGHKSIDNLSENSSETSSSNPSYLSQLQVLDDKKAINYYKSILNPFERKNYRCGSFVERFKILARITKICPIRLHLLDRLHADLSCGITQNSSSDTGVYRLFATIIIDRHSTKYCRLRIRHVNKKFDTSHLTRLHGEQSFLRVSLAQTSKNIDVSCRLASYWDYFDNNYIDLKVNSVVHNLSVLIHIMRDILDATHRFSEMAAKVESELNQENINRLNKDTVNGLAEWSASDFDSLEEQALLHDPFVSLINDDYTSVPNCIEVSCLKIAGQCFQYLTTTSSGVHKNMHIYSVKTYDEVRKKMFSDAFLEENKDYELKLALRMGLWFTPSIPMNLKKVKVKKKKDLEKHTDGCGRMSISLAREMSARWKEGRKYKNVAFTAQNIGPTEWNSGTFQDSEIEYDETAEQLEYYSAFQVRLDGIKGMLVVDKTLSGRKRIKPSPSQVKFVSPEIQGNWSYKSIQMVQCSQPMLPARLNLALISLIVDCARDSNKMQGYIISLAIDEINKLLNKENRTFAIKFALKHNDVKSFNMLGVGCSLLEVFFAGYYQNYMRRFKIVVEKSRRLFGVADFWHVLQKGEVFVSVSNLKNDASTGPSVLKQKVLVTKEPCFHRGDLRTFTTVTHKELEERQNGKCLMELKDVIVFSCCQGEESEPDKICGSDLDGDQYFVCWDANIVKNLRDPLFEPGVLNSIKKGDLKKIYKRLVERQAKNVIRRREKESENEENNADEAHRESTSPPPKLSAEEEEWIRYHMHTNEFEKDVEDEIYKLSKYNNTDEESERNTTEKPEKNGIYIARIRCSAARTAMDITGNPIYFSIHDIFDIYMRIVDNLGSEWTTDKNWQLMEKLCQIISMVLDSAKTGVMTFKKPAFEDLLLNSLPKYPHFDPSKRKNECKHSTSPLGRTYDALRKQLENYLYEQSSLLKDAGNTDEICPDTLYDEISQLKLSFLLHHTKSRCHSRTEVSTARTTHSSNSHTNNNLFDAPLESIIPHVSIEEISEWYQSEIEPSANSTLLKKEAACTMLWKLITLLKLKDNSSSSKLRIVYLGDEESLNDVKINDIVTGSDNNLPFYCITQRLYEDLQEISSSSFPIPVLASKTFFTIEWDHVNILTERLSALLAKKFWRDLKLPYEDCVRRTQLMNKESELSPITFDKIQTLFNMQNEECLRKPVITGVLELVVDVDDDGNYPCVPIPEEVDIYKANNPPSSVLSQLRDILGCLLCFPETWNASGPQNFLFTLCEKIAEISFHHLRMYKYQSSFEQIN